MLHRILNSQRRQQAPGFALVATVSMMVLLTLVALGMLSLSTIEQRSSGENEENLRTARANARMALMIALGELQEAAGPDQRVTATASLLGDSGNTHTSGTTAEDGKKHWVGVWNTSGYSPATPDTKTFVRWLVSGSDDDAGDNLDSLTAAGSAVGSDDVVIFEGADAAGTVKVPKVEVATTGGNTSYYAYWVEDEGVKADLAWNEGSFTDEDREQAARLSAAPGPDHGVFGGPFATGVSYPLESGSGYVDKLEKAFSPADMALVMGSTTSQADWLQKHRHDMGMNVRGVMADVKKGGLRRDLSLAFEMDGTAESESATLFNQQTTEFVGNGDTLSSPYIAPGTTLNDRYLFRDYGPDPVAGTPGAGNFFSDDITQPLTRVRGPSWWLLRDYANLYKRLKTSGSGHALSARAYFPNRSVAEDLIDIHANKNGSGYSSNPFGYVLATNRETNTHPQSDTRWGYAYRPVRANYAPVLLGVNAIYSLVYSGNQLKMTVDPFFIIWNPYNTGITAEKFAITLENGFAGGMRFRHTDPSGVQRLYGQPSGWGSGRGSDTSFTDFAKRKSGVNANVSYLLTGLSMEPGEVMIYSPPNEGARSSNANVLNDELLTGLNYNATDSGIFFNEFPEYNASRQFLGWKTVNVDSTQSASHKIDVLFNIASQSNYAIVNIIETSLPPAGRLPNELTTEANFGDALTGNEFRLNLGGGQHSTNINKGIQWRVKADGTEVWPFSFFFSELGPTKTSFGILSMLTLPTDYSPADTQMEPFSQLNATPKLRVQSERFSLAPLNIYVNSLSANGINNQMNIVGIDIDAFGSGDNGFYGKNYALAEGDTTFPIIDIPKAPLHSLVQLSGANIGTRLFEPTHAIGNSWKPPYIPMDSVYDDNGSYYMGWSDLTLNDVSWQINDALFDRYYFSGIAPAYTIGAGGYVPAVNDTTDAIEDTLQRFYGINPADPTQTVDPATAQANPALEPHVPAGETADDIVAELTPTSTNHDGYQKVGAYSMIKGAFNVNSTSIKAWAAMLKGNRSLALESVQGTTDSGAGTPFPLGSTTSDAGTNNGWEKFSRLTDEQIWDDNATPDNFTDDTGLAVEIVNQVKARGPFMSISDFVNRRIGNDSRSYQGAIQEAIEQAGTNGNQTTGIRAGTSDNIPNYSNYASLFPFAAAPYNGNRNNATGVPTEVNQANILLPLAPRLSARSDTFKIRAYGEVKDAAGNIIAQATCEAVVQRLPEYVDPDTDSGNNEPWDDDSQGSTLNATNQKYGRRFEIRSFRWLHEDEV